VQGVKLRKYGQEVIRHITGKRVHGTAAIPGGMNKALTMAERDELRAGIAQVVAWSRGAAELSRKVFESSEHSPHFGVFPSNHLSLIGAGGELDFYDGGLRALDAEGGTIFDHVDYSHYNRYIREEVKSWSYMKFPFIIGKGAEDGWYRVGPLARLNTCDRITTPLAEAERQVFRAAAGGGLQQATLAYHWARMIEMLHAAEEIERLLEDPDILGTDLVVKGEKALEGVGVIEAPRGTLFHHYKINENDVVEKANLIVSTTNNNQAMNEAVRQVAIRYLDGNKLTEGLLNHIEVAIRAYDPCLSCATHAIGKMPLHVELVDVEGYLVDRLVKGADGVLSDEAV
jgi:NAD-reducing hydrogenase large subunit